VHHVDAAQEQVPILYEKNTRYGIGSYFGLLAGKREISVIHNLLCRFRSFQQNDAALSPYQLKEIRITT
jgi:hypothetical protein